MRASAAVVMLACLTFAACATYQDDLARGERAFEASEHERALAIFRALEPDTNRLTESERAHYAYLRGMTDFRIGYKAEARHWLSVADALEKQTPGSLPAEWTKRLGESLKELNESVFTAGIESLTNAAVDKPKASDDEPSGDSEPKADSDAKKPKKPAPAE
jgi:hypothetical protein